MRGLVLACLLALLAAPLSAAAAGGGGGAGGGKGSGGRGGATLAEKLAGTVWDIAITQGDKRQIARMTLREKDLTCDWLQGMGISAVAYTASSAKNATAVTGTYADASGGKLAISAKIQKDAISGTIQVTTKAGDTKTFDFSGGEPGSAGSKAAKGQH
jgi:hypothetical protein